MQLWTINYGELDYLSLFRLLAEPYRHPLAIYVLGKWNLVDNTSMGYPSTVSLELTVLFRESMWIKIRFDRIVEDVALRRLSYFMFMGSEY